MIAQTTSPRLLRWAVVAVLLVVGVPTPAQAAGTGGIEVTPVPAVSNGKPVTSFRVDVPSRGTVGVPFLVRNVAGEERSARVYTAAVTRDEDGTFSLRDPDSSPFVSMADERVTLAADESRERTFTVEGGELPDERQYAAVVVEVRNGSVVQRASTLIYLEKGRQVPLPLLLVAAAVVLVLLAGAAVAAVARRRAAAQPPALG